MAAQMREGEHKHTTQKGRQADRHVSGPLHHCTQELEPKQPGFVEPSTHS